MYLSKLLLDPQSSEPSSISNLLFTDDGSNSNDSNIKPRIYNNGNSIFMDIGVMKDFAVLSDNHGGTGGYYSSTVNITRILDTFNISSNENWLSLSSNIFTIDGANYPGLYTFDFQAPAYRVDLFYCFLRKDPSGTPSTVAVGNGEATYKSVNYISTYSNGFYAEYITSSTSFDLRFKALNTGVNVNGLGVAHLQNSDPEAFSYVKIIRY